MLHLDLFSGIGGFALAAESVWPDIEHIFCDNDPFSQAIIKKHWPNAQIYGDIRQLITDTEHDGQSRTKEVRTDSGAQPKGETRAKLPITESSGSRLLRKEESGRVFILTGGFPCQPFSQAGRRKGTADDRYLWPEMFRVIHLTKPQWIIAENVRGILTWNDGMVLEQVCTDLEGEGYEVQPIIIPAVAVNAPHRRDRIWFIARNTKHDGRNGSQDRQSSRARSNNNSSRTNEVQQLTRSSGQGNIVANAKHKPKGNAQQGWASEGTSVGTTRPDSWNQNWPEVAARLCTVDDGLPNGLARPRGWRNAALKGAGNAIVPQVAIEIMKSIQI